MDTTSPPTEPIRTGHRAEGAQSRSGKLHPDQVVEHGLRLGARLCTQLFRAGYEIGWG